MSRNLRCCDFFVSEFHTNLLFPVASTVCLASNLVRGEQPFVAWESTPVDANWQIQNGSDALSTECLTLWLQIQWAFKGVRYQARSVVQCIAVSHPPLDLIGGVRLLECAGTCAAAAADRVDAVHDKGRRPLAEQQEAAVRAGLQPCAPELQAAVCCFHIMQQPAQKLLLWKAPNLKSVGVLFNTSQAST